MSETSTLAPIFSIRRAAPARAHPCISNAAVACNTPAGVAICHANGSAAGYDSLDRLTDLMRGTLKADNVSMPDATGAVVERFIYDPYGQPTVLTGSWGSRSTSSYDWGYLHQGGRLNTINGTYHFRNRDYSPTLGRWLQQDPAGYVDGASLYQLVQSNPCGRTDPLGLLGIPGGRGVIINQTAVTLQVWRTEGYGTLAPGEQTSLIEDWDYVQTTNGAWVKVSDGCTAIVLPNGSVVSADLTMGLLGWLFSNYVLIDRSPRFVPK